MSTAHTPGPWEVTDDDSNGQAVVRAEHIEVATCWHHCVGSIEKQMRANALLIAAAPDLLDALEVARNGLEWYRDSCPDADSPSDDETMHLIDAALTKATGGVS